MDVTVKESSKSCGRLGHSTYVRHGSVSVTAAAGPQGGQSGGGQPEGGRSARWPAGE